MTGKEDIHCGFDIVEMCFVYDSGLNCDIVFRKALTSLSFSGRTTSSETASTMETESESDLQDYRSCAFDYRSCAFTPSRFTQGPRTIASVLSESENDDKSFLRSNSSSCVS